MARPIATVDAIEDDDIKSVGVGTLSYAAPEQLKHGIFSFSSDVYSLGVILFEMYSPFSTEEERTSRIEALTIKGMVGATLQERHPSIAGTILQMTEENPTMRPLAQNILKLLSEFRSKSNPVYRKLKQKFYLLELSMATLKFQRATQAKVIRNQHLKIKRLQFEAERNKLAAFY